MKFEMSSEEVNSFLDRLISQEANKPKTSELFAKKLNESSECYKLNVLLDDAEAKLKQHESDLVSFRTLRNEMDNLEKDHAITRSSLFLANSDLLDSRAEATSLREKLYSQEVQIAAFSAAHSPVATLTNEQAIVAVIDLLVQAKQNNKINVIEAVRTITGQSLKAAKDLVLANSDLLERTE